MSNLPTETRTIIYEIDAGEITVTGEVTLTNGTWNDRVARQYAAYHASKNGLDVMAFDVGNIYVEYGPEYPAGDADEDEETEA